MLVRDSALDQSIGSQTLERETHGEAGRVKLDVMELRLIRLRRRWEPLLKHAGR
jgi:hypothetical protein